MFYKDDTSLLPSTCVKSKLYDSYMAGTNILKEPISEFSKCVLTDREIEYLSLASLGFKNKEIAQILSVSIGAVKKTLEIIFQKVHAKDRTNAVTIAFLHDIINIEILSFIAKKYGIEDFEGRIR